MHISSISLSEEHSRVFLWHAQLISVYNRCITNIDHQRRAQKHLVILSTVSRWWYNLQPVSETLEMKGEVTKGNLLFSLWTERWELVIIWNRHCWKSPIIKTSFPAVQKHTYVMAFRVGGGCFVASRTNFFITEKN